MKKRKKLLWALVGAALMLAVGVVTFGLIYVTPANDLGLSQSDLVLGGLPNIESLLTKTNGVADAYLSKHDCELKNISHGPYELTVDYSLSKKIRSLGYRSLFYYYCWDIYLPYSIKTQSGDTYTIIVQVSDGTKGNTHDPDKFRALRAMVIDVNGSVTKMFE